MSEIEANKYSPAEITSLFLRYRGKPKDALDNIQELNDEKFVVNDRKFFGKEIEKLIKDEPRPNGMSRFIPMNDNTYSRARPVYHDDMAKFDPMGAMPMHEFIPMNEFVPAPINDFCPVGINTIGSINARQYVDIIN